MVEICHYSHQMTIYTYVHTCMCVCCCTINFKLLYLEAYPDQPSTRYSQATWQWLGLCRHGDVITVAGVDNNRGNNRGVFSSREDKYQHSSV